MSSSYVILSQRDTVMSFQRAEKNFIDVKITFWHLRYIRLSAENTLACQDVKFGPILMEIEAQT